MSISDFGPGGDMGLGFDGDEVYDDDMKMKRKYFVPRTIWRLRR